MELTPQTLQDLAGLIHQWSGLVIGKEKAYLIRHRLEPLVRSSGLKGFEEFLHRLQTKGHTRLQNAVIDAITTQETSFFRDAWFFEALFKHVLPQCASALKSVGGGRSRIRIWSAGSSTGQEAYSLAMLIREFIDASNGGLKERHFSILASDISGEALDAAKEGVYTKAMVDRGLTEPRLRRHFARRGDRWVANDSLRHLVTFRYFNLLHSPADFGMFDLVLCRNVMIYFDETTRQRVCRNLHRTLQPGAWLAVGAAESISTSGDLHAVKLGRANLYRRALTND
jgi:chemotaxis protein methyltransferase CheR